MALIKCGECGRQVSNQASACPGCGAPLVSGASRSHRVVAVEQTGKKYKAAMLIAIIMIIVGVVWMAGSGRGADTPALPALLFLGGILLFAVAKIGAWWNHG